MEKKQRCFAYLFTIVPFGQNPYYRNFFSFKDNVDINDFIQNPFYPSLFDYDVQEQLEEFSDLLNL